VTESRLLHGPCPECGTAHGGLPIETVGGMWACLIGQLDRAADRCNHWWQLPLRWQMKVTAGKMRASPMMGSTRPRPDW
jgi:hypothetical protein